MARLVWNSVGSRFYETGLDKGVLFVDDNPGVPWSGLTSVKITSTGGEQDPQYIDGLKYANPALSSNFKGTLETFTIPEEFEVCDGINNLIYMGLYSAQQKRKSFGLAYRTKIGNDVSAESAGYKIHIIFDASAVPSQRQYSSSGDTVSLVSYSYDITAIPQIFDGYRPTAYLSINSKMFSTSQMTALTDIIYGTDSTDSRLPTPSELISIFGA